MKYRKMTALCLAAAALLTLFCSCAPEQKPADIEMKEITDTVGRTVSVPREPRSICCVCPFSGPFVVMFGKGAYLTSTCNNVVRSELLKIIEPGISGVEVVKHSGSLNAEAVLEKGTDLIIANEEMYIDPDEHQKLDNLGIPYVVISFTDIEGQLEAVKVLGEALGAEEEAGRYIAWFKDVIRSVEDTMSGYDGEPVKLYHAVNEATRTDYEGSICTEWIAYTKADNVSVGSRLTLEGDKAYTTLEEIYNWDPDVIICNEPGVDDYILSDEKWAGLRCVGEQKVYQMPVGTSRMGHPTGTETPLALLWLSELLYPDLFDVDIKEEIREYYGAFYDYDVTDELADAMLTGDDMRAAKTGGKAE